MPDCQEIPENYDRLKDYLDPDFLKKYNDPKQRLSCESELFIGLKLKEKNYSLCTKTRTAGPDFLLNYNGKNVWIEVVTPREGNYPKYKNKEEFYIENVGLCTCSEISDDNCKLKIASVIRDKGLKYNDYLRKDIVRQDDIKIICVNVASFGIGNKSCPYTKTVMYGIEETYWFNPKTGKTGAGFYKQKPIEKKQTNTKIDMGLFDKDKYRNIDGILCFDSQNECKLFFYPKKNQKDKIGSLFDCWL